MPFADKDTIIISTFIGGRLLGLAPNHVLPQLLAAILLISAWKVWRQH
jgi:hypothetical protein